MPQSRRVASLSRRQPSSGRTTRASTFGPTRTLRPTTGTAVEIYNYAIMQRIWSTWNLSLALTKGGPSLFQKSRPLSSARKARTPSGRVTTDHWSIIIMTSFITVHMFVLAAGQVWYCRLLQPSWSSELATLLSTKAFRDRPVQVATHPGTWSPSVCVDLYLTNCFSGPFLSKRYPNCDLNRRQAAAGADRSGRARGRDG